MVALDKDRALLAHRGGVRSEGFPGIFQNISYLTKDRSVNTTNGFKKGHDMKKAPKSADGGDLSGRAIVWRIAPAM